MLDVSGVTLSRGLVKMAKSRCIRQSRGTRDPRDPSFTRPPTLHPTSCSERLTTEHALLSHWECPRPLE
jgi:hypothetical protein